MVARMPASLATSSNLVLPSSCPNPLAGGFVKIVVGKAEEDFYAHKNLLSSKSPYFATSLKECWNGKKNEVVLDFVEPHTFSTFLTWLYYDSFETPLDEVTISMRDLVAIYNLADMLLITKFKNDIIDATIATIRDRNICFVFDTLSELHSLGVHGTKFYRLFFRSCIHDFMEFPGSAENDGDCINSVRKASLGREILRGVRDYNKNPWGEVWEDKECRYHDHSDGSTCKLTPKKKKNDKLRK